MAYYIASTTCQQWHSQHHPFYCVVSFFSSIKIFPQTNSCSWTTMLITCLRNIMPPFTFQLVYKMYQLQHPQSLIFTLIGIVLRNNCGRNLSFWYLHSCIWERNWYLLWFEYLYLSICGKDFYLLSLKDQTPVHFGVRLSWLCVCVLVLSCMCFVLPHSTISTNTTRQWQRRVRQHRCVSVACPRKPSSGLCIHPSVHAFSHTAKSRFGTFGGFNPKSKGYLIHFKNWGTFWCGPEPTREEAVWHSLILSLSSSYLTCIQLNRIKTFC